MMAGIRALSLAVALLSAVPPVHARQESPAFGFFPAAVPAGSYVNLFGSGFSTLGSFSAAVTLIDGAGRRSPIGSGTVFSDGTLGGIAPIPDFILPGNYDVEVRDDTTGAVAVNMTGRLTITASPQFSFAPRAESLGGAVSVAGSGFAPGSRAVVVLLRSAAGAITVLGSARLVPTATGLRSFATRLEVIPPVEPGVYRVLVRDVTTRQFAENRTGLLTIAAPNGPDLQATVSDPPPLVVTCPVCPASIPVFYQASNAGLDRAGATNVQFYLSADRRLSATDLPIGSRAVPELAPGQTSAAATTLSVPFENGTFFLLACADRPNVVAEVNELNNCRASRTRMTIFFIPD